MQYRSRYNMFNSFGNAPYFMHIYNGRLVKILANITFSFYKEIYMKYLILYYKMTYWCFYFGFPQTMFLLTRYGLILSRIHCLYICFLFPNIMLLKVYRKFKCNDNNNPQSKRANLYVRRGLHCREPMQRLSWQDQTIIMANKWYWGGPTDWHHYNGSVWMFTMERPINNHILRFITHWDLLKKLFYIQEATINVF
jgi:hypothetical protein